MTRSKPSYLPKALPPNTIILGIRASKYDLWGDITLRPQQCSKCFSSNDEKEIVFKYQHDV